MAKRSPQLALIAKQKSSYGGELMKTRAGRVGGRPLAVRQTMHLVLRSSQAKGAWSFRTSRNAWHVHSIVTRFANNYGVRVLAMANVGNHLHLHIKLSNRFSYVKFIRAVTGAIAQAVTGRTRWAKKSDGKRATKFWDYRPYTRIVESFRALLNIRDYVRLNELEGFGYKRHEARDLFDVEKHLLGPP